MRRLLKNLPLCLHIIPHLKKKKYLSITMGRIDFWRCVSICCMCFIFSRSEYSDVQRQRFQNFRIFTTNVSIYTYVFSRDMSITSLRLKLIGNWNQGPISVSFLNQDIGFAPSLSTTTFTIKRTSTGEFDG